MIYSRPKQKIMPLILVINNLRKFAAKFFDMGKSKPTKKAVTKAKPVAKIVVAKAKPATKKTVAKPIAKKVATKPAKKIIKPIAKKIAKPVAKKAAKPVAKKVVAKPAKKTVAKPVSKKVVAKPTKKVAPKAVKKVLKPVAKKAASKPLKKVSKPVAKKVVAKPAKVVAKSAAKKAVKPAPKAVAKKAVKPAPKAVIKKAVKPAPKQVVKPTPKPVAKKVVKAAPVPAKKVAVAKPVAASKVKPAVAVKQIAKNTVQTSVTKQKQKIMVSTSKAPTTTLVNNEMPIARYSDDELKVFKDLIDNKLEVAREELKDLKGSLDSHNESLAGNKSWNMEEGSDTSDMEYMMNQISRQHQYLRNLEAALVRIENKTYGICRVTGKLIPKERLRLVPHATLSVEAKQSRKPDDSSQGLAHAPIAGSDEIPTFNED